MADLISRKALLEELDKWINPCVNYDKSEFLSGIATAISEVETAPTVDAAPVVHGKWVHPHWRNSDFCYNCSVCNGEAMHKDYRWADKGIYPICPHCGAKMDGGNDND